MSDVLQLEDRIYVLSTSSLVDDRRNVLKHGESFIVFDRRGDLAQIGLKEQGLYHEGCRHLSRFELLIADVRPVLLGVSTEEDNNIVDVDLTNPDIGSGETKIRHGSIHILRSKVLWAGTLIERISISNFENRFIEIPVTVRVGADFNDIFEVRGVSRIAVGMRRPDVVTKSQVTFTYVGLDGVERSTLITVSPEPLQVSNKEFRFVASLQPQATQMFEIMIRCEVQGRQSESPVVSFAHAVEERSLEARRIKISEGTVTGSNSMLTTLISQGLSDLHILTTMTEDGAYPYAGVPWFSAVFGRDAIISALMALWINPVWAKGVLKFLARHQAREEDPHREAQPGKILHELRLGEMAGTGEVPFAKYYGTVDATPLFVLLAYEYLRRTGDLQLIRDLWPSIIMALDWLDTYGDLDGDGFVEYAPWGVRGLVQQGWKDSHDSVFHRDGRIAEPPIALCEVQGYTYAAKLGAAQIAIILGDEERAQQLIREAETLKRNFHERFWDSQLDCFALALDGHKNPCSVRTSNAGHTLFSGIAESHAAAALVRTLFLPDMFSGWGIRTVSSKEVAYNPLSYHNGSIWPHDTAMIAYGLAQYGFHGRAAQLLAAILEASNFIPMQRLPELYCGFERREGQGPTLHPIACSPQAWAAASSLYLIQACLGLSVDGLERRVVIRKPCLPESVERLEIHNILVGDTTIDIGFQRYAQDVGVHVLRRGGDIGVSVLK